MNLQQYTHVRIRKDEGELNVEKLVKSIESEFKIDFTSLKYWKKLLKEIDDKKQDYENKIKSAHRRKLLIIDKLQVQNFRLSPFSLTDKLARTENLWKELKFRRQTELLQQNPDVSTLCDLFNEEANDFSGEVSDIKLTAHPNSEIVQSEVFDRKALTLEAPVEAEIKGSTTQLPIYICTNQHKIISPLESQFSGIAIQRKDSSELSPILEFREKSWELNETKCLICKPSIIKIHNATLKKQAVQFSLTNSCIDALYIRFNGFSDTTPFKKASIFPQTPTKLYPGLSVVYTFDFILVSNVGKFEQNISFRVRRNFVSFSPDEVLHVPVRFKPSKLGRLITVTETVIVTPIYTWQINIRSNYPTGILCISVDSHSYYIHIKKRVVDFSQYLEDSEMSINVTGHNTESVIERINDVDTVVESKLFTPSKNDELFNTVATNTLSVTEIINCIIEDIVKLSLDTFLFQKTCVCMLPNTKCKIPVLFAKAEHEGYHQSYYDVEFYDLATDSLVTTKVIKVFGEAKPHPVHIYPSILDMSESPIYYGFREDRFKITNTHKFYSVSLKVKLTEKMNRLFRISPMIMTVPCMSESYFTVRTCSNSVSGEEIYDLVHFTIKIVVSGHESIYRNVPPFFLEIIVPCASEFKKIYGKK